MKYDITTYQSLATSLRLIRREVVDLGDPQRALVALDTVLDRLDVAQNQAHYGDILVSIGLNRAYSIGQDAALLLQGVSDVGGRMNEVEVAGAMLTVAAYRVEQVIQACLARQQLEERRLAG